MNVEIGRIDHTSRHVADPLEAFPFKTNPFSDRASNGQGMLTTGFTIAPHDRRIRRFQKENFNRIILLLKFLEDSSRILKKIFPSERVTGPRIGRVGRVSADIFDHGHLGDLSIGLRAEFQEFRKERDGKVIHAVETDIFQGLDGRRFPGA